MITDTALLSRHRKWVRRAAFTVITLVSLIAVLALVSLCIGRTPFSPFEVLSATFGSADDKTVLIIQELRLPRTLLSICLGAATGMAGAALQGFLRNPLAEPSILGISSCAGLGAVVAIYFGVSAVFPFALPLMAMAGAGVATMILYAVGVAQVGTLTMILTGMAINSVALALINLAMNLSSNPYAVTEMVFWLMGSVKNRTLTDVGLVAPFVIGGLFLLSRSGKALDAFSLGEETARTLGIDPTISRISIVVGVTAAVGGVTAVTGGVGFVGLVVPHLLRPILGHLPSRLLWPSAFGGALAVLIADTCIRLMAKGPELQLGVLTSLIGAPFFVYLVMHTRKERL